MSWDIFSKSKIQYFLEKLKGKFVQKETGKGLSSNDYTTTDKNKVALIDNTTTSATGNPISITNLKSAQIALNPVITFEPIQAGSGTSSPSNIRAISGYDKIEVLSCGKNTFKCDFVTTTINGITFKNNGDGTVTVNGTATANTFCPIETDWTTYDLVRNHNYFTDMILTGCPSGGSGTTFALYMRSGNAANRADIGNGVMLVYSDTSTYYPAIFIGQGYTANNLIFKPMFRLATISDATFEPYHKTTDLSESLGQTVYGGTLDVRTGEFTVKYGIVDLGDSTYTYNSQYQYFYTEISSMADSGYGLSDRYQLTTASYDGNQPDNSFKMSGTGNKRIFITNRAYNNATTFKTAMVGAKVAYELATPFTIQLTPHEIALSQGYNYISSNGTSISLAYHNGELASLADVSQLGETVNEILSNQTAIFSSSQNVSGVSEKHFFKVGNLVNISCRVTGTFNNGAYTDIGTIAYRPLNIMWFPLINRATGTLAGVIRLTTDGTISVLPSANLTDAYINLMFIANKQ